jgi:pyruvate dehydrogenase E2 component (dihydrolipoamide acetyltransferase)
MRIEYRMPALGADMDYGTVVEWHVQPGSRFKRGDVVAVVETDKGAIDVEIFEEGVVAQLLVQPGTKVPVGTPLALIEVEGLAPSPALAGEGGGEGSSPSPALAGEGGGEGSFPSPALARERVPAGRVRAPDSSARVRISPAARIRAKELGVDISTLTGSGPDGAVTRDDVERSAKGMPSPPPSPSKLGEGAEPSPQPSPSKLGEGEKKTMRDAIAASMSRSKREIPHYYLSLTADVTHAVDWLAAHNAAVPVTERLLFAALLVKAVALACRHEKGFSGFYRDGRYEEAPAVHVGVAVAIRGGGLVAPAILDTAIKPLPTLMQEFRDIVARARAGRLKASELAAPTIILTSLGDSPVESVFPIIQPPQVAIVGAGAVLPRPWVCDGQLVVRQLCTLSLGADHRVTDGRLGAQFLGRIARLVAAPDSPEWSAT